MTRNKSLAYAAMAAGAALFSVSSQAALVAVSCPGTVITTDREFGVTTDPGTALCLDFGTGNINGNNDVINAAGYVTLDKSDDLNSGELPQALTITAAVGDLSGTFAIDAPGYTNFVLAFKSGQGQLDPDWAAFTLPSGVTTGSWSISGQQSLSHANLYAQVVPIPAAGWLLGTGVLTLLAARRKNRR